MPNGYGYTSSRRESGWKETQTAEGTDADAEGLDTLFAFTSDREHPFQRYDGEIRRNRNGQSYRASVPSNVSRKQIAEELKDALAGVKELGLAMAVTSKGTLSIPELKLGFGCGLWTVDDIAAVGVKARPFIAREAPKTTSTKDRVAAIRAERGTGKPKTGTRAKATAAATGDSEPDRPF